MVASNDKDGFGKLFDLSLGKNLTYVWNVKKMNTPPPMCRPGNRTIQQEPDLVYPVATVYKA